MIRDIWEAYIRALNVTEPSRISGERKKERYKQDDEIWLKLNWKTENNFFIHCNANCFILSLIKYK